MTTDKSPEGAQDEALRLAALFELYAIDHEPDGWPAIRQRELTAAAAELRKLLARVQELERAVAAERDACAALCERVEARNWAAYKGQDGPVSDRGSPRTEGMADGAGLCAQMIRARGAQGVEK